MIRDTKVEITSEILSLWPPKTTDSEIEYENSQMILSAIQFQQDDEPIPINMNINLRVKSLQKRWLFRSDHNYDYRNFKEFNSRFHILTPNPELFREGNHV